MSNELIAIIGVGVTLAGIILYSQHNMRSEVQSLRAETRAAFNIHLEAINRLRDDVNQLQARMAHQEGLMEGLREAVTGLRDDITGLRVMVAGPGQDQIGGS